jgi:hypothetical protein
VDNTVSSLSHRLRAIGLFGTMAGAVFAMACGDPLTSKASLANQFDTLAVFSLSGTSIYAPTALNTTFRFVSRADNEFNYDLAFDLDANGDVHLIPVRLVGGVLTSGKLVGLQKVTGGYEALLKAPSSGYVYDSVVVVKPGDAVAVQVTSDQCLGYSFSQQLYSKLGIDSVNLSQRKIFFRLAHDPNCGFRSFATGLPKS